MSIDPQNGSQQIMGIGIRTNIVTLSPINR